MEDMTSIELKMAYRKLYDAYNSVYQTWFEGGDVEDRDWDEQFIKDVNDVLYPHTSNPPVNITRRQLAEHLKFLREEEKLANQLANTLHTPDKLRSNDKWRYLAAMNNIKNTRAYLKSQGITA